MVHGTLRRHGGFVRADRHRSRYRFELYWPLAEHDLPGATPFTRLRHGAAHLPRKVTVLVVEDEPLVRALAVRALQEVGYTVEDAPDGRAALERLDRAGSPPVRPRRGRDHAAPAMGGSSSTPSASAGRICRCCSSRPTPAKATSTGAWSRSMRPSCASRSPRKPSWTRWRGSRRFSSPTSAWTASDRTLSTSRSSLPPGRRSGRSSTGRERRSRTGTCRPRRT